MISWPRLELPGSDIGIHTVAIRLSVGTEGEDVDFAVRAGIQVMVRTAPGVVGQALQVRTPVGIFCICRALDQYLEALVHVGIGAVVEAIKLERLHQAGDVLLGRNRPGLVRTVQHFRHDNRRQNAEDDHHHHDLDQREPLLSVAGARPIFDAREIHIHHPWLDPNSARSVTKLTIWIAKIIGRCPRLPECYSTACFYAKSDPWSCRARSRVLH
ncbi:hypothetical protein EMIT0357P_50252 [Pseudomonas marginalis]